MVMQDGYLAGLKEIDYESKWLGMECFCSRVYGVISDRLQRDVITFKSRHGSR